MADPQLPELVTELVKRINVIAITYIQFQHLELWLQIDNFRTGIRILDGYPSIISGLLQSAMTMSYRADTAVHKINILPLRNLDNLLYMKVGISRCRFKH